IEKGETVVHQTGILPIGPIAYPSVLQVPEHRPTVIQAIIRLGIEVKVVLIGIILIIAVPDIAVPCIPGPDDFPKMIPSVLVVPSSKDQVQSFHSSVDREYRPIEIIVQPTPSDQVRG